MAKERRSVRERKRRVVKLCIIEKLSECPVLINTSFNIRGEPIVNTPFDALKVFMNTKMDILVLENFVLQKENQSEQLVDTNFKDNFSLD